MAWNEFVRETGGGPNGSSTDPIFITITGTGVTTWKDPVADVAALPLVGNTDGDARITLDTHTIYIWDGAAWNAVSGGGGTTVHNSLTGLQGGTTAQYYHLTSAQNTALTTGVDANGYHTHGGLKMTIRNETGVAISAMKVVYITGFNNYPLVALADNTNTAKHHPIGVTTANINDQANGSIVTFGLITGVNTNGFSAVGAKLYLSTAGTLTETMPSSGEIIFMGEVSIKDNNGSILLYADAGVDYIAAASGQDIHIRMGDSAGVNKVIFENYGDAEVASINSQGLYTGGLTAIGNDTEIQFNSSGSFGADADFCFDPALGAVKIGQPTVLPNNPLAVKAMVAGYAQINMQNGDADPSSSSDIVATADNGDDTTHYIDMGINSSTYSDAGFTVVGANGTYLLASDDDLAIGTSGTAKKIRLFEGGTLDADVIADLDSTGVDLKKGTYMVNGKDIVYHNHNSGFEDIPVSTEGTGTYTVAGNEAWFYDDITRDTMTLHTIAPSGTFTPANPVTGDSAVTYCCADRDTDTWVELSYLPTQSDIRYEPAFKVIKRNTSNNLHHQLIYRMAHGDLEATYDCEMDTQEYKVAPDALRSVNVDAYLNITVSGGNVWIAGKRKYDLLPVSPSSRIFKCYQTTVGTWSIASTTGPTLSNTSWNDVGVGLDVIPTDEWAEAWIYRGVEDQDHFYYVYGTDTYASSALARANNIIPTLPILITSHAQFIGRIIFQESRTTGFIYESAFATVFAASSAITTHNSLTGRTASDTHPIASITGLQTALDAKVGTNATISFTLTGSTVQMVVNGNILQEWEIGGDVI